MSLCVISTVGTALPTVESTRIEPRKGRVGDVIRVTIDLKGGRENENHVTVQPVLDDSDPLTTWTLLEQPQARTIQKDKTKTRVETKLLALRPGQLRLPEFEIRAVNDPTTPTRIYLPDTILIETTLGESDAESTPTAPLIEVVPRWVFWAFYAVVGAVFLAITGPLVWLAVRNWRLAHAPRPKALNEWALDRLEELERSDLLDRKCFKEFYTELADVVRVYVGKLFGFDALDLTSSELLDRLESTSLSDQTREELHLLLTESDMVKFAKYVPEMVECRRSLDRARRIVRQTAPLLASPEDNNSRFQQTEATV